MQVVVVAGGHHGLPVEVGQLHVAVTIEGVAFGDYQPNAGKPDRTRFESSHEAGMGSQDPDVNVAALHGVGYRVGAHLLHCQRNPRLR